MFLKFVYSDYRELYPKNTIKNIFASCINPTFHAASMVRCAQFSPKYTFWVFRFLLLFMFSIDVGRGFYIGKGLRLPHPVGIVFGGKVRLGNNCTVYQNVTFGMHRSGYPLAGDNCIFYTGCIVVGPITIKDNCTVGALQFLSMDLNKNSIYRK